MPARHSNQLLDSHIGTEHSRLKVIAWRRDHNGQISFHCECRCGTKKWMRRYHVMTGLVRSCGCYLKELTTNRSTIHGGAKRKRASPEYRTWLKMRSRCTDKNDPRYENYGGRGIGVHQDWNGRCGFLNFLSHVGLRPSEFHSIDRIDNDGNYEPGNVRWATDGQQATNTTKVRLFTHAGRTACLSVWAREIGIGASSLSRRIRAWGIERALTTPASTIRKRKRPIQVGYLVITIGPIVNQT